jgi:hypothetical protein
MPGLGYFWEHEYCIWPGLGDNGTIEHMESKSYSWLIPYKKGGDIE